MSKKWVYPALIAVIFLVVIFGCCQQTQQEQGRRSYSSSGAASVTRGWLCDYDGRGEVVLWMKAGPPNGNAIADRVRPLVRGCVDVILLEKTNVNAILYYKVRVGGSTGWVDVDYYYPRKPSWCVN